LLRSLLVAGLALASMGVTLRATAASPASLPDHDAYYPGEPIVVSFANGPGNPKDWIGIYPTDIPPGSGPNSTAWKYVDDTQGGLTGLREGSVLFPDGLALAGDWAAYLLFNDGYATLTTNLFRIVDPGTPLVRIEQRLYATGQPIRVTFTNGPANAKDWVGIYKQGQTPGSSTPSTLWNYVDGTQAGTTGLTDGVISFTAGLSSPGEYVVHFLANDSYDIIASETFSVAAPTGSGPRILSTSPADGSSNQPPVLRFTASITNGTSPLLASSVVLKLDGVTVPAVVTQADGLTTVTHTEASLPPAGSTHVWSLTAADGSVPPNLLSSETRTTIGQYANVVLPAPVYFENFDAVPEGSLPAGWTGTSYTEITNPEEDLGNLDSATFARWTTVAADRFNGSFVTYSNPDAQETDYQRVLTPNLFNVMNGSVVTGPLANGRFLFGDSGYRNGRSQVLWVTTPDYDLTGKTNIHLVFKSLWEQNQDSIATIEYSVDQGASWLPIAYFIDRADLITVTDETTGAVSIDVETTLWTERGDVARYTDDQGNELGGAYGAFVAAPISPELAPFIHGRIDDNPSESKRIESFPLPQAASQSKVRIRFGHAGTDSWYFGIDDFGIYSLSNTPEPMPALTLTRTADGLVISWPAGTTGVTLESTPAISPAAWSPVSGVTGSSHRITPGTAAAFYRLRR
jgi:hypothetical protein